jgi:hypothetical protein
VAKGKKVVPAPATKKAVRPNSKKTAIKAKRGTFFELDPDKIKLVADKGDVLCQQDRLDLPLKEDTIANYMELGMLVTRIGEKDGPDVRVVAGRRGILYLREANKRRRAAGLPAYLAKVEVRRFLNDGERLHVMYSENKHREGRDEFLEMREIQRHIANKVEGFNPAIALGCSPATVENRLRILDLDSSVQKVVQEGAATITEALSVVKLPRAQQKEALDKKVAAKAKKKADKAAGLLPKKAPSKETIRALVQVGFFSEDGPVKAAFLYAIGDLTDDQACEKIVGLTKAMNKVNGVDESEKDEAPKSVEAKHISDTSGAKKTAEPKATAGARSW